MEGEENKEVVVETKVDDTKKLDENGKPIVEPDYKALHEKTQTKLTEALADLDKLKNKDTNFGNLKNQTEEEKKKHGEEKQTLEEQIKTLSGQLADRDVSQVDDWYKTTVHSVVGENKEVKDAIKKEYDILNMPTTTREEVVARVRKAMTLSGNEPSGDLTSLSFGGSREEVKTEKKFHETERGQGTAKFLAPHLFKETKKD